MKAHDLFNEWLNLRATVATPQTIEGYRGALVSLWAEFSGSPKQLSQSVVADWVKRSRESGINPNTIRLRLSVLRRFLAWARTEGKIDKDPTATLPKIRPADAEKVPFTWDQFHRLMDACAGFKVKSPRSYWNNWPHAILVAWHTGLRFSDVCALKWDSCDFVGDVLRVAPKKLEYSRQQLSIPMAQELRDHLLNIEADGSPYVDSRLWHDYQARRTALLADFRIICDRAGFERQSFHSLRHSFVSRLLNAGVDAETVRQMSGQSLQVLSTYAHISMNAKRKALEQASEVKELISISAA